MKLNIVVAHCPIGNAPEYEPFYIQDLDKLEDASCTGIYTSSLCFTDHPLEALQAIVTKLRYDASIIVEGVEILEVARNLHIANISIQEANALLFQEGNAVSCVSINNILDFLTACGLKIKRRRIEDNHHYIEAVRINDRN